MYIPFQQLPDQSRVWVYQANRPLVSAEIEQISSFLVNEMNAWAAHGAPLNASFEIRFNQVVIVAVNEDVNQASGCSIDASTHWFKSLGEMLHIDFFDRQIRCWRVHMRNQVQARGRQPYALDRDIGQIVGHELTDFGAAIDIGNDLEVA